MSYENGFYQVDELQQEDQKFLDWYDNVEIVDGSVWLYDVVSRCRIGSVPICYLTQIPATRFVKIGF